MQRKATLIYTHGLGLWGHKPEHNPLASGVPLGKQPLVLHNSLLGTWIKPIWEPDLGDSRLKTLIWLAVDFLKSYHPIEKGPSAPLDQGVDQRHMREETWFKPLPGGERFPSSFRNTVM